MKTYLARYWAVYGISLVAPALAACGDSTGDPSGTGDSETQGTTESTGPTTMTPTSSSTTDNTTAGPTTVPTTDAESTSSSTTNSPSDPSTSDTTAGESTTTGGVSASSSSGEPDTTTGGPICMTILCGDPAMCCAEGDECVDGTCLPACPSGVRCGDNQEMCCDQGDVCVGDTCTTPGGPCIDSYDCDPGEYCEAVLGNCLPQPDPLQCEVVPNFDTVDVQLEWAHTADQVIAMPAVADLDGDGIPEVVVNTTRQTGMPADYPVGELICLNGADGTLKWRIPHNPNNQQFGAHGRATIAIGDVSGDGKPDIVYAGRQISNVPDMRLSPVHAVDGDGKLLWTSRTLQNQTARIRIENGAAALANLDTDPMAEIAFGAAIFDHDGLMVVNQGNNGGMYGTPHNKNLPTDYLYPGGLATFANLDNDSKLELVTGREAWEINWVVANPPMVSLTQKWKDMSGFAGDGFTAVGDLDMNGTPEVVLTAWPEIKILDGATGKLWCGIDPTGVACQGNDAARTPPIDVPGGNLGGPATIADFDGDGRPEIGIATGADYRVFDLNRNGEQIVKLPNDPMPAAGAIYTRWVQVAQDKSSAATGSSVFDFQGDGVAEVAYQDECYARVYDGATGEVKLQILNSSATIHEYPLVADVDGDGNSEFVVVANYSDTAANNLCLMKDANYVQRRGVFVYGAGGDNWVPTRKLWTQHTYHVTNAESDGNVPMMEQDNWDVPGLNNFRQNVQGEGVFNAADLTASLAVDLDLCAEFLILQATIYNEGALGVPAGVEVAFYEGTDNTGTKLTTVLTSEPLLTGGSTIVTYQVMAPPAGETRNYYVEVDGGMSGGNVLECNESNNGAVVTDAECPTPG
jgi:hypothetical protein